MVPGFIMIEMPTYKKVVDAHDYQRIALNNYIENGFSETIEYGTDSEDCFTIGLFVQNGLLGDYADLYQYTQGTKQFLISQNFHKLSSLCGFMNRTTEYI